MIPEFTTEQLESLSKHIRDTYYALKKEKRKDEDTSIEHLQDLLTCAQQIDTIKHTPFMLKDILDMIQWDIAGEPLEELPLRLRKDTPLLTMEVIKWRLENGI